MFAFQEFRDLHFGVPCEFSGVYLSDKSVCYGLFLSLFIRGAVATTTKNTLQTVKTKTSHRKKIYISSSTRGFSETWVFSVFWNPWQLRDPKKWLRLEL